MPASIASRVAQKARRLVSKEGMSPRAAFGEAVKLHEATDWREHKDWIYARFNDPPLLDGRVYTNSYLRVAVRDDWDDRFERFHIALSNLDRFEYGKIIDDIHAYCDQCGRELWCERNGIPSEKNVFDLPGQRIFVCGPCQRDLVKRALVGE